MSLGVRWVGLRRAFQYLWDHKDLNNGESECEQTRYPTKYGESNYCDDHSVDEWDSVVKHRSFEYGGHHIGLRSIEYNGLYRV